MARRTPHRPPTPSPRHTSAPGGRRRRWVARVLAAGLLTTCVNAVAIAHPAWACGCGGVIPHPGESVTVQQESSVVVWDGTTETIAMQLSMAGDAASAAWVLPVPATANVVLGDPVLFDNIADQEAPRRVVRRHFLPGDWENGGRSTPFASAAPSGVGAAPGAAAPAVTVLSQEQLGPFDVAQLAATDPAALSSWLTGHGYQLPGAMATALQPYVAEGWQYVAVRLTPGGGADTLNGVLPPLVVRFASGRLVYPMRLSVLATTEQHLRLALLAPHRMAPQQVNDQAGPMEQTFADHVQADRLAHEPALKALLGTRQLYLTDLSQDITTPSAITSDDTFTAAPDDTPDVSYVYTDELLRWFGVPAYLVVFGGGGVVVLLVLVTLIAVLRRRNRRHVPPAGLLTPR